MERVPLGCEGTRRTWRNSGGGDRKKKRAAFRFKGNPKVDKKKFEEALKPTMMSMSLTGEPALYLRVSDLNVEVKKRGVITFLVTNGTMPKVLENMDPLPFRLYVSVSAADKNTHVKLTKPLIRDGGRG